MSFFDKNTVDTDKLAEVANDLGSLIGNVRSHIEELDSYADRLERLKDDMDAAESVDEVDDVVRKLRDEDEPDGYEDCDSSPDTIADECEECRNVGSEYEKWQEEIQDRLNYLSSLANTVARGGILPSSKELPYDINNEATAKHRVIRPGEPLDDSSRYPYENESSAWKRAVYELADRAAATEPRTGDGGAAAYSKFLAESLFGIVNRFMVYKDTNGMPVHPEGICVLSLMWFVDNLLHAVSRHLGYSEMRLVITNAASMKSLRQGVESTRSEFADGCSKIDEAIPATR
jgi:hypothetical protein